jgi:hypothetical protein
MVGKVLKLGARLLNKAGVPSAQNTLNAFKVRKVADCYFQRFIKFNEIGVFHSYSELLHAALLESDPLVSSFTPQPKGFNVNGKPYIPDCFYIKDGKQVFIEIKPRGKFTESKLIPLKEYTESNDGEFLVVSNESILEQRIKAQNWLYIIRQLISGRYETTIGEEEDINRMMLHRGKLTLSEIIDQGNRAASALMGIALFRLVHEGRAHMNLETKRLSYETEVQLCE